MYNETFLSRPVQILPRILFIDEPSLISMTPTFGYAMVNPSAVSLPPGVTEANTLIDNLNAGFVNFEQQRIKMVVANMSDEATYSCMMRVTCPDGSSEEHQGTTVVTGSGTFNILVNYSARCV